MEMLGEFQSVTAAMADASVLVDSSPLQPPQTATTVRVRNGDMQLSDGPFAEIKEQIGRYYILDCEDVDTALRYAAIPSAKYVSVEIRPLMVMGPHIARAALLAECGRLLTSAMLTTGHSRQYSPGRIRHSQA
jgi:hypothetical protein